MKASVDILPQKSGVVSRVFCRLIASLLLVIALHASTCAGDDTKDILTPAERLWLMQNKSRIVLAIETGYAPFVFLDSQDQPAGLAHEFLQLLESKIGFHFNQRRFSSLDDILAKVRSGEVQIVNAVTKSPARSGFISFTAPFITVPSVIVVRSERTGRLGTKDLSGLKLSLVKSYAVTEFLENKNLGFVTDLAADDLAALYNVSFKRSDATVIDLATASYLITKKNITNLRVAGEANFDYQLSMGVPNTEPVLYGILQKGLRAITEAERQEIRTRWVNPTGQSMFSDRRLWLATAGFCLLIAGIVTWNRMLRLEVRKKTRAITESAEKYKILATRQNALLSAVPDIIMEVDNNKMYTWSNSAGREFFGEDVIGKEASFYIEQGQNTLDAVQPLFQGSEKVLYIESWQRRKDGEIRLLAWWCKVLEDEHGSVKGTLSTARDITEHKRAEIALQDKNTELERFTYSVSHDLKSPLITIQSFAGQIKHDVESGRYSRVSGDLARIISATSKMADLLRDLLALSRAGKSMDTPARVDMQQVVSDVLTRVAGLLREHQVDVLVQPGLPAVYGDEQRITTVLQNLVENAVKYRSLQLAPHITIGSRQEGATIVFFVSDNGLGIEARFHDNIFGLFNKLDSASEGTGVGLALVKRIIEVHGGRVWVESKGSGTGSTFCFTLPTPSENYPKNMIKESV